MRKDIRPILETLTATATVAVVPDQMVPIGPGLIVPAVGGAAVGEQFAGLTTHEMAIDNKVAAEAWTAGDVIWYSESANEYTIVWSEGLRCVGWASADAAASSTDATYYYVAWVDTQRATAASITCATYESAGAIAVGAGVVIDSQFLVAKTSTAGAGEIFEGQITGPASLAKVAAEAWAPGEKIYFNTGTGETTNVQAAGLRLIGTSPFTVAASTATATVLLDGAVRDLEV